MNDNKKILFTYQSVTIDSVYAFDDGDFIIFGNCELTEYGVNKIYSNLYDGKTLSTKLTLKSPSASCFFDLKKDDEFGVCINYCFTINKFISGRTSYKEIQPVKLNPFETGRKLIRLLNGDILFFKYYMGSQSISVFKKRDESCSSNSDYMYNNINNLHIDDLEDIIELNKNQFLGYKRSIITPESLTLTLYNDSYQIIKKNKIIAEIKDEVYKYKKKIYFTTDLQKYNDSKLITAGCNNIYIIDIQTLELETTINLEKTIRKILIRPKGNIFVLTYVQEIYKMDMNRETSPNFVQYFLNNIKIDFKTNEMIYKNEKDITEHAGIYNSFFDMYNYPNNGLVVNIDKSKLIIYDNFDD